MGNNSGNEFERGEHKVTVSDFYISDHEVTQLEYSVVMRKNPSKFRGQNKPVDKVTWYEAVMYCNKLSAKEGLTPCYAYKGERDASKWGEAYTDYYAYDYEFDTITCDWSANGYRLPTEAEWEYAARGGSKSKGYVYSGSDNLDEVAWGNGNSGSETRDVKTKKPNELGLYDMSGNVSEWCWDWRATYAENDEINPKGFSDGYYSLADYIYKVLRGKAYNSVDEYKGEKKLFRITDRTSQVPYKAFDSMGFRVARNGSDSSLAAKPATKKQGAKKANSKKALDDFVLVEGGTFTMGRNEGDEWERPAHQVTLDSFYICDHELTQKEFKEIMRINPSQFRGDERPAEINWYQTVIYCNLLSEKNGLKPCYSFKGNFNPHEWEPLKNKERMGSRTSWDAIECDFSANGYRIPTEAEWEYAAKGGNKSKGYVYAGSNDIEEVAWYDWNTAIKDPNPGRSFDTYHHETCKVKQKKPNELGLYDMSGNVNEWCWDWWGKYDNGSVTNPKGENDTEGYYRVMRGGGYQMHGTQDEAADVCRVTKRHLSWPKGHNYEVDLGYGVRLVRNAK